MSTLRSYIELGAKVVVENKKPRMRVVDGKLVPVID